MTDFVTYQVHSKDPNNYGTISFNPDIPWNTHKVEYKVTNLNTFTNFLITTDDDYIELKTSTHPKQYKIFKNKISYEIEEVIKLLNEELPVTCTVTDTGVISMEYTKDFEIIDASHRVKLLLGLYHSNFPINSNASKSIIADSTPMLTYGNVLYLKSNQGNALGMIIEGDRYHTPCIYRINNFLKPGLPIISNQKGDRVIVNAEAAKTITMQLVDFMYEPIVLKSPMFVTLKIKLIPNQTFN